MPNFDLTIESDETTRQFVAEVRRQTNVHNFDLAVILGSGWKEGLKLGQILSIFNYAEWPCFPLGQVEGHGGQLVAIRFRSWNILFFSGRFHCYQGLTAFDTTFPVRLAARLGSPRILLTCATGGINKKFRPGEFMLVEDHLNFLGDNPLRGLPGNTFIDMGHLYTTEVYNKLSSIDVEDMVLHRGVLASVLGPSYETPSEIRFLEIAGADVVSMSTVPEAIMARFLGLEVAAAAFVANYGAGISPGILSHEDVLECSVRHAQQFPRLITLFVEAWQD